MTTLGLEALQQDHLALSVGHALALANDTARKHGVVLADSLITIAEEPIPTGRRWRIHFGPRDFLNRRGGDLTVVVDETASTVLQIQHGQ